MEKVKVQHGGSMGIFWIIGWLFTVGFLKFGLWKGALALIVWPWFLGAHFSDGLPHTDRQAQLETVEPANGISP